MTELLTDTQVAKGLHIHVRTLRRRIRANMIALNFIPMGRKILFRPDAVEEYIRSLEVIRTGSGRVNANRKIRVGVVPKTVAYYYRDDEEFVAMSDVKARKFFKRIGKSA